MSNTIEYKGYIGTVEFSSEDNLLYGKVIGINGLISFQGSNVDDLRKDFQGAIDNYLEMCREKNIEPQKTYKGSFNIRISPELHRSVANYAAVNGKSLNSVVEDAISNYVAKSE